MTKKTSPIELGTSFHLHYEVGLMRQRWIARFGVSVWVASVIFVTPRVSPGIAHILWIVSLVAGFLFILTHFSKAGIGARAYRYAVKMTRI